MSVNRRERVCKYNTSRGGPWHLLQWLAGEQSARVSLMNGRPCVETPVLPGPPVTVPGHRGQLIIGCYFGEVRGDFTTPLNAKWRLLTGLLSHLNKSWGQMTLTMATPFGSISESTLSHHQKCHTGNGAVQHPSTVATISHINSVPLASSQH